MLTKDTLFRRFVNVSNKALTAALLCLLSFASVSCKGDIDGPDPAAGPDAAREISFNPGTGDAGTKTSYTNEGETDNGQLTVERIDWVNGDLFTVVSPQAKVYNKNTTPWSLVYSYTTPVQYSVCDYRVQSHSTATNPAVSRAIIGPAAGADGGLQWGDGAHTFYAMYPSVNTAGYTAAEKEKIGIDATQFKGTIPEAQTPQWGDGNGRGWPQMQYAYMFATTSGVQPESGAVDLNFLPQFTAFEFTVESGENDAVVLTSFEFEAANGGAVTGDFVLQHADPDRIPVVSNASSKITVNLNDTTITKGSPFIFTVLALPVDMTNMRMKFTGPGIGTRTAVLKVKNNNNEYVAVNFTARNKYRITGIAFPKGITGNGEEIIWDQEAFGEEVVWGNEYVFEGNLADVVNIVRTGGYATLATGFRSCILDGTEAHPEPFCIETSPTGADGSWTEGLPDWLTLVPGISMAGVTTPSEVKLAVSPNSGYSYREIYVRLRQPATGSLLPAPPASCRIVQQGFFHYFTVNGAGKKVRFAPGNLVVTYKSDGNHLWEFEKNQYDYSWGKGAGESYDGMNNYEEDNTRITHFGWGTSGIGLARPPYDITGQPDYNSFPTYDWTTDWGKHFDDDGNGLNSTIDGTYWYTLSISEWEYLMDGTNGRLNASNLAGQGRIYVASESRYVNGFIILPDNWIKPTGCDFSPGIAQAFTANSYTTGNDTAGFAGKWTEMEDAGAIFLPAAGYRTTSYITGNFDFDAGHDAGFYWSKSTSPFPSGDISADCWFFKDNRAVATFSTRLLGHSVRLVHNY